MKKIIAILFAFLLSICLFGEEGTQKKCSDFLEEDKCPKEKCLWTKDENGKSACVNTKAACKYCSNKKKKEDAKESFNY